MTPWREESGRALLRGMCCIGSVLVLVCGLSRVMEGQAPDAVQAVRASSVSGRATHDSAGAPRAASGRDSATTARDTATGDVAAAQRDAARTDAVTQAAHEYERTGVARTVEEGAFVTFPYGHGQPTLTCAPLRACVIELEAGETVLSRIAGDTQRWEIELAPAGPDGRTPLVVVKPHDCGLTTNLVLSTSAGRIYDLTLDSPPCARAGVNPHGVYIRHVRFYYPDAMVQAWAAPVVPPTPLRSTTPVHADAFNFAYQVRRLHRFPWTPIAVFDDGVHCYIKLPPQAARRDAPVLFALADDGSKEVLNYSVTNQTYVTDRVFRSAVLVIGEAVTEQALRIDNLRFDGPADAGGSPSPEGETATEGVPR
jgi:type IV secretion system protein VirB9